MFAMAEPLQVHTALFAAGADCHGNVVWEYQSYLRDIDLLTKGKYGSYSFSALHFESTVRIKGEIRTNGIDPRVDY
jgi:hypothetical protein